MFCPQNERLFGLTRGQYALTMIAWLAITAAGCQQPRRITRRPINQLYREAVEASDRTRNATATGSLPTMPASEDAPAFEQAIPPSHAHASRTPPTGNAERKDYRDYFYTGETNVELVDFRDEFGNPEAAGNPIGSFDPDGSPGNGNDGQSELLNESFDQTDIREAISILASLSGVQTVIDDTVGGIVTAEIRDATFDQALGQVLAPLGYEYAREGNQYFICPADPNAPLFSKIANRSSYQSQYQNIVEMIALLPERYEPFLKVSESRNMVSIDAPPKIIEELTSRLAELDQPVPQVELEAIVCVVAPDSGFRFGLDWNQAVTVDGVDSLSAGITGLAFNSEISRDGLRNAFSKFSVTSTFVRALAKEGYVSIRAAPRVTARDGEKAEISIARESFFSLQPSSSNVLFRQDVQKVEAGIGLDITPRIRGNVISVQIDRAEVSEDIRSGDSELNISNSFPVINRRRVSTNVDVGDGETIVIGGLVQRQQVEQFNRIPVLGDLPIAGRWFQTKQIEEMDVEVAIFISPRIVPPPAVEHWPHSHPATPTGL